MHRAFSETPFTDLSDLFRVMDYAIRDNKWEEVHRTLEESFPSQAEKLGRYLNQHIKEGVFNSSWLTYLTPRDPMAEFRPRYGLNMSRDKYRMAKAFIAATVDEGKATPYDLVNKGIDLVVIIYACIDLSLPLPSNIKPAIFWRHVSDLITTGREFDLYQDLRRWPIPRHLEQLPDGCRRNKDDDPQGTVETLFYIYLSTAVRATPEPTPEPIPERTPMPEGKGPFEVYVAASEGGTAGMFTLPYDSQHFSLRRAGSPPGLEYQRESYALLDATCVWAHVWTGRKVVFFVSSERLAACVNAGPQDATARTDYPVLEALAALSIKWNFTFEAQYKPLEGREPQSDAQVVINLASLCWTGFHRKCGLVIEVLDSLMGLLSSFEDEICEVLQRTILKYYMEVLLEHLGAAGAQGWEPGSLYQRMRLKQQDALEAQIVGEDPDEDYEEDEMDSDDEGTILVDELDVRRKQEAVARKAEEMKELGRGIHDEWVKEAKRLANRRGSAIVELARMDATRGGAEGARLSFWPPVVNWRRDMEEVLGLA